MSAHPLLIELADFVDGRLVDEQQESVGEHVRICRYCRVRIDHAARQAVVPTSWSSIPDAATVRPELLRQLHTAPRDPDSGQLWRLRWEGVCTLVVILKVDGDDVAVCPVTLDPWMADDYTIVVTEDWSPLAASFAVWVALEAVVPMFVLDRYLGDVDALDQIAEVRLAFRKGIAAPDTIVVGPRIADLADERSTYRHALASQLHTLSAADWLEVSPTGGAGEGSTIAGLLEGVEPHLIAETLDLDRPSTFALLSGERQLTESEAQQLAGLADVTVEAVLAAVPPVPPRLINALNHPRHRESIERHAQQRGHDPIEERRAALAELLPVAARRAGDEAAPLDWHQLVADRYRV